MPGTARRQHLGVRCARTWDCKHHIACGRRPTNCRSVRRGPHRGQGPFQEMAGTRQRGRKRRRLLAPGRPEKRMEKSDAPNARGTARRRLWKRSLPLRKRKKRRRTTVPAMQSEPRPPGPGLNVPELGAAADWSGSCGRAIKHPRHVTGCWGPNRLSCHILERQCGKPLLLADRAGTGLRGREMGRPSHGGSIRVAQHQPDGVTSWTGSRLV